MTHHINDAPLYALSKAQLFCLWRNIAAEIEGMPEGSPSRIEAEALIARIRGAIICKRQGQLAP
ncbi:hypothetical protein [Euryhalocaulis caribicus]|uniref:hypothetical protein n=1 Tax=Euryhalocaulis caribicus TaxID=1161401 RepID=UPI0012689A20|nr:hypothetical protein [Euryhalocaulis caribicus]